MPDNKGIPPEEEAGETTPMPPRGIVPMTVRCPREAGADALLIATWRAEQFGTRLEPHLAHARALLEEASEGLASAEIGISAHDLETLERLGCAGDVEAGLLAAWLAVGVETVTRRASTRSSWDHKLVDRRLKIEAA